MKFNAHIKSAFIETVCFLYVVLFVYAAVSKMLDFKNFQVQLAQSPLITSFAGWVSYMVIGAELAIAVTLCFRRLQAMALQAAFSLMLMFSAYIVLIMYFSPFVPCSCGGILEHMDWGQHLVFNLVFTCFAFVGVMLDHANTTYRKKGISLAVIALASVGLIVGLFLASEDIQHRRNNFTRRYPHHPAEFLKDFEVDCPSCYIAGVAGGKVYLGDLNDPLRVMEFDSTFSRRKVHHIRVDDPGRRYYNLKLTVSGRDFYLSDGRAAFIYRGAISDWKARIWMDQAAYFNAFVPMDSTRVAIRSVSSSTAENILGILEHEGQSKVTLKPGILKKQSDGIFDTDGRLLYNAAHRKLLYLYTYRNTYIVTDPSMTYQSPGHTIDTTRTVGIKTAYVPSLNATKLASPARVVNKNAATDQKYLYVNAALIGQHEPESMWGQASVIDVYDFIRHRYLFSFYLYDKKGEKIANFAVGDGRVYTLAAGVLSIYRLDPVAFKRNR